MFIGSGFVHSRTFTLSNWRMCMPKNEIAFTKQALLATRDWDTFQALLRKCLTTRKIPITKNQ